MAKAGNKTNTTSKGLLLSEAKAWGVEVYEKIVGFDHAAEFAQRLILGGLETGQIPWSCSHATGDAQHLIGRPEFWRNDRLIPDPGGFVILMLEYVRIDYEKNSASRSWPGLTCYLVRIDGDAFAKLLPVVDTGKEDTKLIKFWVPREAKILKRAGKIAPEINPTDLARLLVAVGEKKGLGKAKMPYIRDNLKKWGLWPISKI